MRPRLDSAVIGLIPRDIVEYAEVFLETYLDVRLYKIIRKTVYRTVGTEDALDLCEHPAHPVDIVPDIAPLVVPFLVHDAEIRGIEYRQVYAPIGDTLHDLHTVRAVRFVTQSSIPLHRDPQICHPFTLEVHLTPLRFEHPEIFSHGLHAGIAVYRPPLYVYAGQYLRARLCPVECAQCSLHFLTMRCH